MSFWVAGHITGGLGNRLFQHASAMGLAEKWGHRLVFYLPAAAPTNHGPFENLFKLFPDVPFVTETQPHIVIPEPNGHVFTFTPFQEERVAANLLIDGYRQTERYFPVRGVHASLEAAVSEARQQELLHKYNLIEQKDTTCFVHFRLGDYKILPHHQIDIGSYLQKASQQFPKGTRFLVFSDEASEYKAMFESTLAALGHIPVVVTETDELESLYLMSQCGGGAIVANSTFSWWGAYFARQRAKDPSRFKACYPEVWGMGLPPARDVVPSWGIRIPHA